jgi:hypothetical protein
VAFLPQGWRGEVFGRAHLVDKDMLEYFGPYWTRLFNNSSSKSLQLEGKELCV